MTPAVNLLEKKKIAFKVHRYDHDPGMRAFGKEAAEKLAVPPERLFKTLVIEVDQNQLMVAVVPVAGQLDLKLFARAVSVKKAVMADRSLVERTTGYLAGGVSPLAQKKRLKTVIDLSAKGFETVFISGGRRGLQIELSPVDLAEQSDAGFGRLVR